ncbi:unnamed protein product [Linum tenue]|uniref:Uncharacterized protein n=2 Tax=Linum tenue TaxID=586396 RepID=A0AAV0PW73_9ROSI|nr:unnamed protein product [Linum tenue]
MHCPVQLDNKKLEALPKGKDRSPVVQDMDEASSNPIDVSTNATSQGDPPLEVDENEEELKEFCLDESTIMSDLVDDD